MRAEVLDVKLSESVLVMFQVRLSCRSQRKFLLTETGSWNIWSISERVCCS